MLPVLSSPPAACSGCAGWVCSSWRTAAARSHSCLSSPVRQNRGNIQHSTTVLTAPPTGPPLLTAPTFFTILLLSRPYMRSSEPQFFTWGWSICRIFWDASCLPTLLFLPVGERPTAGSDYSTGRWYTHTMRPMKNRRHLHQPLTVCFPHVITYSLFWFFPGITSNCMLVSPIPWFLQWNQTRTSVPGEVTSTPVCVCVCAAAHLLRHSWRI